MLFLQALPKRVKSHWQLSLLVLLLLPLLIGLGNWQLSRAEQKRQVQAVYQQQRDLPAVSLNQLNADDMLYRKVMVRGIFDKDRYWLLDNRSRGGRPGYEVITPLVNEQQQTSILVNRGWIAATDRRDYLPLIPTPEVAVQITGYLYPGDDNALISHSMSDLDMEWPKRVLQLDATTAGQALGVKPFPLLLRIHQNSPGAFLAHWEVTNASPEKHQGYAVQWFAMAVALLILYGYLLSAKIP